MTASLLSTAWFAFLLIDLAFCYVVGPTWPRLLGSCSAMALKSFWLYQASQGSLFALWACALLAAGIHCRNLWCCRILTMLVTLLAAQKHTIFWLWLAAMTPIFPPEPVGGGEPSPETTMAVQDLATYGTDDLRIAFRGTIIDEPYIAASTNGNGGCALHACFGIPSATGLFRSDVREQVLRHLPTEYSTAAARLNAAMLQRLDMVLGSVWEYVQEGARCQLHGKKCKSEQRIAWNAIAELPEVDAEAILSFVQQKEYEKHNSQSVRRQLRDFYSRLFQVEHEDVVRELCILLSYLQANPDVDLHSSHSVNAEVQRLCGGQ